MGSHAQTPLTSVEFAANLLTTSEGCAVVVEGVVEVEACVVVVVGTVVVSSESHYCDQHI